MRVSPCTTHNVKPLSLGSLSLGLRTKSPAFTAPSQIYDNNSNDSLTSSRRNWC
ncbi:hypothetical protein AKO1_002636 [Acrasis kona]|uniref:Uncharacterized protein n=1 Tax=Acrasis kona TaxID=1008807 RepID=A0AAW2ZSZ4_9EUKA